MKCPSCNQTASSFLRYVFSLQGVTISKSMQGFFKCQNCGTLLRVTSFGKHFWVLFAATVVVLAFFLLLHKRLFLIIGTGATAAIWVILVLLITSVFTFGIWKYAHIEKVIQDTKPTTNVSS